MTSKIFPATYYRETNKDGDQGFTPIVLPVVTECPIHVLCESQGKLYTDEMRAQLYRRWFEDIGKEWKCLYAIGERYIGETITNLRNNWPMYTFKMSKEIVKICGQALFLSFEFHQRFVVLCNMALRPDGLDIDRNASVCRFAVDMIVQLVEVMKGVKCAFGYTCTHYCNTT
ncbi:MAG: hypothetical protein AAFO91_00210, partial [Bacteroidota bacterium]